jgi:hypothetical protein
MTQVPSRRLTLIALAMVASCLAATPSQAWTPASQVAIAEEAARLAPPDLARQILRHADQYQSGVLAAFRDADPMRHKKNDDGTGSLDRAIAEEADSAIDMIRQHRPFAEVAHQLGRVSHFVADADNPLNASQVDPQEGSYFKDFLFYAQSAQQRFVHVFYGIDPRLEARNGMASFTAQVLARARRFYPLVGAEYRRVGRVDGQALFDDRSTAFAVVAVSFSHALSDSASVLRYIWLRSGGFDPRRLEVLQGQRLLVLPQHAPAG